MTRLTLLLALGVAGCRIGPAGSETLADSSRVETPAAPAPPAGRPADRLEAPVAVVGDLAIPVVGVVPANLVNTFDDARRDSLGDSLSLVRVHDAIDIAAPRGTAVVAAAPGRVARTFESENGGHTVYVVANDGHTVYYYAHLDAYAPGLAAGQRVARGAPIGTVGSTGNASSEAPHLHFAVWIAPDSAAYWNGEALNPYPLLGGR